MQPVISRYQGKLKLYNAGKFDTNPDRSEVAAITATPFYTTTARRMDRG